MQVMLTSATRALYARLVLEGRALPEVEKRFNFIAFGCYNQTDPPPSEERRTTAAKKMLCESGIIELQENVLRFLFRNAANIKRMAVLEDVDNLLRDVLNVVEALIYGLRQREQVLQRRAEAMHTKLKCTLTELFLGMAEEELQTSMMKEVITL